MVAYAYCMRASMPDQLFNIILIFYSASKQYEVHIVEIIYNAVSLSTTITSEQARGNTDMKAVISVQVSRS